MGDIFFHTGSCNFQLHEKNKNKCTAVNHIPHYIAQMMDSEKACVFTGRCFNLVTSNA